MTIDEAVIDAIIIDLNAVAHVDFRIWGRATRDLIRTRLSEGFTIEDFKHVHRVKSAEWGHDPKWSKFLRPSTLYRASKFEAYLNQRMENGSEYGPSGVVGEPDNDEHIPGSSNGNHG